MKKHLGVCTAAAMLIAATSANANPRTDPKNDPPSGGGERGEKAYQAGCAIMWMLGFSICQELDGAPKPKEAPKKR